MANQRKVGRPRGPATVRYYAAVPVEMSERIETLAAELDRPISWVLHQSIQLGFPELEKGWEIR